MGSKVQPVVAAALLVVAVLAGLGLGFANRTPTPVVARDQTKPSASSIDIHVAGWVMSPGVVSVPPGSITAVAIDLAGGLRPGALVDQVNLAAEVFAGDQIIVPGPETVDDSSESDGLISINRATASDLESLPGVGPVLAGRIVAHREANGRFGTVEDLLEVPGIGESKLASIRDLVRP